MSLYYLFGPSNGERCGIVGNCVLLCDVGEYEGCGAYVGAVEEMMCVVCVDVTEGA